jgi:hypothetical protein
MVPPAAAIGVRSLSLILFASALTLVGCGQTGPPQGRLSGKATLDGQPLSAGEVHVYSKTRGTGGRATLDASGQFKFAEPMPEGDYVALVTPLRAAGNPGVGAAAAPPASSIPRQYQSETTSDLKVTVQANRENTVTLDLRGDGKPISESPRQPPPGVAAKEPPLAPPASSRAPPETKPPATPAVAAGSPTVAPAAAAPAGGGITWPMAVGGGVVAVLGLAAGAFLYLRKRSAAAEFVAPVVPARPISSPFAPGQSPAYPRRAQPPTASQTAAPPAIQPAPSVAAEPAATASAAIDLTSRLPAEPPAATAVEVPAAPAMEPESTSAVAADSSPSTPQELPVGGEAPAEAIVLATDDASSPVSEPLEESSHDRNIAQWILEKGGRLRVMTGGSPSLSIDSSAELPASPFRIKAILFQRLETLRDDDLEPLKGLADLHLLDLASTKITDTGLRHIAALTHLRELSLSRTMITDAGLQFLKDLHELQVLLLYRTAVTDAGMVQLRNLRNLKLVELKHTGVTDAALEILGALPRLQELHVRDSLITDAAIARFKGAFPEIEISGGQRTATPAR